MIYYIEVTFVLDGGREGGSRLIVMFGAKITLNVSNMIFAEKQAFRDVWASWTFPHQTGGIHHHKSSSKL